MSGGYYQRKPTIVEAVQRTEDGWDWEPDWLKEVTQGYGDVLCHSVGFYIVRESEGNYHTYSPEAFEERFKEATQ